MENTKGGPGKPAEDKGNDINVLTAMYSAEHARCLGFEAHRTQTAQIIIVVTGALIGFVTYDKQVNILDFPAVILIIILGVFGMLFSYKYYELHQAHLNLANKYRDQLDALCPPCSIAEILNDAERERQALFPNFRGIPLHRFWFGLYAVIVLLGVFIGLLGLCGCR